MTSQALSIAVVRHPHAISLGSGGCTTLYGIIVVAGVLICSEHMYASVGLSSEKSTSQIETTSLSPVDDLTRDNVHSSVCFIRFHAWRFSPLPTLSGAISAVLASSPRDSRVRRRCCFSFCLSIAT